MFNSYVSGATAEMLCLVNGRWNSVFQGVLMAAGRCMDDVVYGGVFSIGNQKLCDIDVGEEAIDRQTASTLLTMIVLRSSIALSTAPPIADVVAWGGCQFSPLVLSGLGGRANRSSPGTINISLFKP